MIWDGQDPQDRAGEGGGWPRDQRTHWGTRGDLIFFPVQDRSCFSTEILSNVIPEEPRRTPLTNTLPNPTRPSWINCAGRFPVQPSLLMSGWQLAEQGSACVDQIRPCLTRLAQKNEKVWTGLPLLDNFKKRSNNPVLKFPLDVISTV